MLFLLETMNVFHAVPGSALLGLALVALGVRSVFGRLHDGGLDGMKGTPGYELGVLRAVRGSVWLIAVGLLLLLVSFHLVDWDYSWPWLIILAGVMMLLHRAAYNTAAAGAVYGPPQATPQQPQPEPPISAAAASDPASRVYVTPPPGSSTGSHEGGL
jgi:hypothetical protein